MWSARAEGVGALGAGALQTLTRTNTAFYGADGGDDEATCFRRRRLPALQFPTHSAAQIVGVVQPRDHDRGTLTREGGRGASVIADEAAAPGPPSVVAFRAAQFARLAAKPTPTWPAPVAGPRRQRALHLQPRGNSTSTAAFPRGTNRAT